VDGGGRSLDRLPSDYTAITRRLHGDYTAMELWLVRFSCDLSWSLSWRWLVVCLNRCGFLGLPVELPSPLTPFWPSFWPLLSLG
jgi:hypothetical protein